MVLVTLPKNAVVTVSLPRPSVKESFPAPEKVVFSTATVEFASSTVVEFRVVLVVVVSFSVIVVVSIDVVLVELS